mmetsp:Transcript_36129/g.65314  ORF Transcript_36129/g.65314 Transcript_36129/m.65314 type:complete len:272 (+) Transcript_36129:174-989(+)
MFCSVGLVPKHRSHLLCEQLDHFVPDASLNQQIVRGDARLSSVRELVGCNAPASLLEIYPVAHDDGRLAPQLQGDRRHIRGRSGQDELCHSVAPGVHDVVEGLRDKSRGDLCSALDAAHGAPIQPVKDPLHHVGALGRQLGRLHHQAVSSGQGSGSWADCHVEGVVPRTDDQHHTLGLRPHPGRGWLQSRRGAHLVRSTPLSEVVDASVDLAENAGYLKEDGLRFVYAKVGVDGLAHGILLLEEGRPQQLQLLEAPLHGGVTGHYEGPRLL